MFYPDVHGDTAFRRHFDEFREAFGRCPNLLTIPLDLLPVVKHQVMRYEPIVGGDVFIDVEGCHLNFVPAGVCAGMYFSFTTTRK